jgi:hypothetical protein
VKYLLPLVILCLCGCQGIDTGKIISLITNQVSTATTTTTTSTTSTTTLPPATNIPPIPKPSVIIDYRGNYNPPLSGLSQPCMMFYAWDEKAAPNSQKPKDKYWLLGPAKQPCDFANGYYYLAMPLSSITGAVSLVFVDRTNVTYTYVIPDVNKVYMDVKPIVK